MGQGWRSDTLHELSRTVQCDSQEGNIRNFKGASPNFISNDIKRIKAMGFLIVSGETEVNLFFQIRLILGAKFGNDP